MSRQNTTPSSAQLSPEEYLTEREMSSLPVLLVEGDDDSIFFQLLKDEILKREGLERIAPTSLLEDLEIDTSAIIASPSGQGMGNREKVEYVCSLSSELGFKGQLFGFVDREFRGIEVLPNLFDEFGTQRQVGNLFWSRGHSIENYFFDLQILRDGLRYFSVSPHYNFQDALNLFRENFDMIIRLACAFSFASKSAGLNPLVPTSFDSEIIEFIERGMLIREEKWESILTRKIKLDPSRKDQLVQDFRQYLEAVKAHDANDLKWLCHGHIGLAFIWTAFSACIRHVSQSANGVRDIRAVNKLDKFIQLSTNWLNSNLYSDNYDDTPIDVFLKFGLAIKMNGLGC